MTRFSLPGSLAPSARASLTSAPALVECEELASIAEAHGTSFVEPVTAAAVDGSGDLWVADGLPAPGGVYKCDP